MKNICVIGGSGFIGSRLCGRLERSSEHRFQILDKAPSRAFPDRATICDVRDVEALKQTIGRPDVIVNLAAEHRDDVRPLSLYDAVNVEGARNVAAAARAMNVSIIVFTSSVAVYGFAPINTGEDGKINPFNDYGRTKHEAELILQAWQAEAPEERTLVIVRPTVVFGERNRGNVYNLLKQIVSGRFVMIGSGENKKSLAYVENVAAFIEYSICFSPGIHVFNFTDKPDFTMNRLVAYVRSVLGRAEKIRFRLPYGAGYMISRLFDVVALLSGRKFAISSIRVKKFCANSIYTSAIAETGFVSPISLDQAIRRTIEYEFIEDHSDEPLYFSE